MTDAPTGQGVEVTFGPDLQPRTADRTGLLLDLVNRAQCGFEAKAALWRTLTSDLSMSAQLAELQTQQLPPALLEAVTELLAARA